MDMFMKLKFKTLSAASKETGLSYLGATASSAKIAKGLKYNEETYILYLAPANQSGYEVCPMRTPECTNACLHESGHNRIDISNRITNSRIKKTKLFFENREFFMEWLVAEITKHKLAVAKAGRRFSVRLNGTSDIEPTLFRHNGKTLFELFPDVQFYDYTKVAKRFRLLEKYTNYDLTYSFSGDNLNQCIELLKTKRGRVAIVFEGKRLPETFMGYKVIDGDKYDMRYLDEQGVITGLRFKHVRNKVDLKSNRFIIPETHPESVYSSIEIDSLV